MNIRLKWELIQLIEAYSLYAINNILFVWLLSYLFDCYLIHFFELSLKYNISILWPNGWVEDGLSLSFEGGYIEIRWKLLSMFFFGELDI